MYDQIQQSAKMIFRMAKFCVFIQVSRGIKSVPSKNRSRFVLLPFEATEGDNFARGILCLFLMKKGNPGRSWIYKLKQMIRKLKIALLSLEKAGALRH